MTDELPADLMIFFRGRRVLITTQVLIMLGLSSLRRKSWAPTPVGVWGLYQLYDYDEIVALAKSREKGRRKR